MIPFLHLLDLRWLKGTEMTRSDIPFAGYDAKPRRRLRTVKWWVGFALILVLLRIAMYPWAFFLGGHFHPLGFWRGWGRMHSKTAGDYLLYVEISPTTYRYGSSHAWDLTGSGHLCTPKGERFALRLNGDMPRKFYIKSLGQPLQLGMDNWRGTMIVPETRPAFSLWGTWAEGEVRADDRKTLSQAFLPDGTLRPKGSYALPSQTEDIQVTLREGSYSEWEAACRSSEH
jgi:hypothetical protein